MADIVLLSLPSEMLGEIRRWLNVIDRARLQRVCTKTHALDPGELLPVWWASFYTTKVVGNTMRWRLFHELVKTELYLVKSTPCAIYFDGTALEEATLSIEWSQFDPRLVYKKSVQIISVTALDHEEAQHLRSAYGPQWFSTLFTTAAATSATSTLACYWRYEESEVLGGMGTHTDLRSGWHASDVLPSRDSICVLRPGWMRPFRSQIPRIT